MVAANLLPGWRTLPAVASDRFYLGLDVGQSLDPSAVAVIQHTIRPIDQQWEANDRARTWKQQREERFLVRHLERLPLQQPYPVQIQYVASMLGRDPLKGATFALDYTGVGRPVADLFTRAGLRPEKILITSGFEVTRGGTNAWHVPKQILISALEARLHSGELKIAAHLAESAALADELKTFGRSVSEAGRVQFSARSGKHDDLVLAVAIALFAALNRTEVSRTELRL